MGNLCSTERERDAFAQPGRRLGAAPAARTSASVPTSAEQGPRKVGGPPQTLGGGAGSGAGQAAAAPGAAAAAADDAQRRAATAAEVCILYCIRNLPQREPGVPPAWFQGASAEY
jgi:hypothetical protein